MIDVKTKCFVTDPDFSSNDAGIQSVFLPRFFVPETPAGVDKTLCNRADLC